MASVVLHTAAPVLPHALVAELGIPAKPAPNARRRLWQKDGISPRQRQGGGQSNPLVCRALQEHWPFWITKCGVLSNTRDFAIFLIERHRERSAAEQRNCPKSGAARQIAPACLVPPAGILAAVEVRGAGDYGASLVWIFGPGGPSLCPSRPRRSGGSFGLKVRQRGLQALRTAAVPKNGAGRARQYPRNGQPSLCTLASSMH